MRKNGRKLALNRETLRSLEALRFANGGASAVCGTSFNIRCGTTGDRHQPASAARIPHAAHQLLPRSVGDRSRRQPDDLVAPLRNAVNRLLCDADKLVRVMDADRPLLLRLRYYEPRQGQWRRGHGCFLPGGIGAVSIKANLGN